MAMVEDALKMAQKAESDAATTRWACSAQPRARRHCRRRANRSPSGIRKRCCSYEKEALGFYITAHPLDKYDRELRRLGKLSTADLDFAPDGSQVRIAGVVQAVKLKNNKAGKRYATFSLEDREGAVEVIAWPETYQKHEALIMGDEPVVARGKLDVDDERAQMIMDEMRPLNTALVDAVREVHITAPRERLANGAVERAQGAARAP